MRTSACIALTALLICGAAACGEPSQSGQTPSGDAPGLGGSGAMASNCPGALVPCARGCVDLETDPSDCGACGVTCGRGALCAAGRCACPGGLTKCGEACVDLSGDGAHCGACDTACADGLVCSSGTCQLTCTDPNRTACGTSCAELAVDPGNCGACGAECAAGASCIGGVCTFGPGGSGGTGGTAGESGGGSGSGGSGGATGGGSGAGSSTTVCATAGENEAITLACPAGQVIDTIPFASYGTPGGSCGAFRIGSCHAAPSADVVQAQCARRTACTVPATNGYFGDPCNGTAKSLFAQAVCVRGEEAGTGGSGGGQPFKGVANSSCAARTALAVSWYYNWTQREEEPCAEGGGEFVPMIWGHQGAERSMDGIASSVGSFVSRGQTHVLAFNEPDNCPPPGGTGGQSCIPVTEAISLLPAFDDPAIRVGSPATAANANPGQAWFTDYMARLNADPSLRNDFLAIHWYGWNVGSCDANASQLESYIRWVESFAGDRPIWITEWGCLNQSAPDVATVVAFYKGALAVFARHPRIERYAWYPWATNCGLVNDDGTLTPLGVEYAAAPAYR